MFSYGTCIGFMSQFTKSFLTDRFKAMTELLLWTVFDSVDTATGTFKYLVRV